MINIRPARASDAAMLARLWTALLAEQQQVDSRFAPSDDAAERWNNDFREWVMAPEVRRILVAESDGEAIGFATACTWWPPPVYDQAMEVYIEELYVDPDHRRQGIGSRLLNELVGWAREKEVARVRLGALATNENTLQFWRRRGATEFLVSMLLDV